MGDLDKKSAFYLIKKPRNLICNIITDTQTDKHPSTLV